jgi:hypothetical protein
MKKKELSSNLLGMKFMRRAEGKDGTITKPILKAQPNKWAKDHDSDDDEEKREVMKVKNFTESTKNCKRTYGKKPTLSPVV